METKTRIPTIVRPVPASEATKPVSAVPVDVVFVGKGGTPVDVMDRRMMPYIEPCGSSTNVVNYINRIVKGLSDSGFMEKS